MPVASLRHQLATLRGRMVVGSAVLLALMFVATWVGYSTAETLTTVIEQRFAALRSSLELGTELNGLILQQIGAGRDYLETSDPSLAARFAALGRQAHDVQRKYLDLPALTPSEQSQVVAMDALHSRVEVDYALAHALHDLGRDSAAQALADSAAPAVERLQNTVQRISAGQADKMEAAAAELGEMGHDRQDVLLIVLTLALGFGFWIMYVAVRGVSQPLRKLMGATGRMGEGDLTVQLEPEPLQEFDALSGAFNAMAGRLRKLVLETMSIAEQISASAFDLSSISEEVAASSGEVATAMVEITHGAERQSGGLQSTRAALEEMERRTQGMASASQQVATLSEQIHQVATESREQVSQALSMLLQVRGVVHTSAGEVRELEDASSQIERFVESISGIARQTNLLALNAAIEAARAGEHGRGFAVVAEEVRKLADGSARAAQEVAQVVGEIRSKVAGMVQTMEGGSRTVAGVEEVSRAADEALVHIVDAVDDIGRAAARVGVSVQSNHEALEGVVKQLDEVSATAESHAASAQQVSAAAEEQSAATEEMSGASGQLLEAADRMKELVSGLSV
ncbi:MAG TPA: methyl-accepting chemotaxis protein [Longimicrobiaceae bacterium]|nr:methyl-accepting chemotaxis protein [Longimicrobiaceae bacterium]